MKYPHIATGRHIEGQDARFRINTAPGIMHEKGVNEAHGSFLQRDQVVELRDELDAWLRAHPTPTEQVIRIVGDSLDSTATAALIALVERSPSAPPRRHAPASPTREDN